METGRFLWRRLPALTDCAGPPRRVICGGSWFSAAEFGTHARRSELKPA
jgi:hypothetical protein